MIKFRSDKSSLVLNNPLIERYRYSVMRPSQLWIYVAIYVIVLALILFINYSIYRYQQVFPGQTDAYRSVFYQFMLFQVLTLVFWGAFNTYSAISSEIHGNSYDFFRMLPLRAYQKATGILLGKNLVVLLFSAINLVFFLLFGILGRVNIVLQGQFIVLLAALALLANSMSLLSSVYSVKGKRRYSPVVLVVLAFFILPSLFNASFISMQTENLEGHLAPFFNINIPILLLVSLIAFYFSIWAIKGVARKFNREREPMFTRGGAILFSLGYEIIILGLFSPRILEIKEMISGFWIATLLPVLPILTCSLRSYDNYLEVCGADKARGRSSIGRMAFMLFDSNVSLGIGLLIIWAAFCVGTAIWHGLMLIPILANIVVLFSFLMVLMLLAEIWKVYQPFFQKIGILCLFLAGLYLFLPLILAAVMNEDAIFRFCLIGYFGEAIIDNNTAHIVDMSVLLINFLLCALLGLLVLRQYAGIVKVRRRM